MNYAKLIRTNMPLIPIKKETNTWIEVLLKNSHKKQYKAKTTIINEGDQSNSLYYILSGSVSVVIEDEDDHKMVLSYLNSGEFFGEMGLFDDDTQRTAWVVAKTQCELAEITYDQFKKVAETHIDVIFALASQLASRLKKTNKKVRDLAFFDVAGRVAHTLLELCKEPDAITHPDGMQIKITRLEIARIVGCSRERVGSVLKELQEQGLITAHGKTMVIFGTR